MGCAGRSACDFRARASLGDGFGRVSTINRKIMRTTVEAWARRRQQAEDAGGGVPPLASWLARVPIRSDTQVRTWCKRVSSLLPYVSGTCVAIVVWHQQ